MLRRRALRHLGQCVPPLPAARLCSRAVDYEDELQRRQIKSAAFYESEGQRRRYFYHVDVKGRLFLEDTLPKNIATSLKSPAFLE